MRLTHLVSPSRLAAVVCLGGARGRSTVPAATTLHWILCAVGTRAHVAVWPRPQARGALGNSFKRYEKTHGRTIFSGLGFRLRFGSMSYSMKSRRGLHMPSVTKLSRAQPVPQNRSHIWSQTSGLLSGRISLPWQVFSPSHSRQSLQ